MSSAAESCEVITLEQAGVALDEFYEEGASRRTRMCSFSPAPGDLALGPPTANRRRGAAGGDVGDAALNGGSTRT